ncbi:MAG: PLP-dependent transferase [Planctomycetes bacterium]|nr:PLP-dependent transferase [Planctomycetota bacterium]
MAANYGTRTPGAPAQGPLSPPLVRATSHAFADAETIRAHSQGERAGDFYPRLCHGNGMHFESLVAETEATEGAVAFASGMAALHGALLGTCSAGDLVAVSDRVYGGTEQLVTVDLPRLGIGVARFDPLDPAALPAVLARRPRLVMVETPINPTLRLVDLGAVCARAHEAGALVLLDGTFAPPPVQRATELGVDLVMHSATKFYGGHSDCLAGVVAGPCRLLDPIAAFRTRSGGVLAPDVAWLLSRSHATLALRVAAQQERAAALAAGLAERAHASGAPRAVHYPGLASHPDHLLCRRQMTGGGTMLTVEVAGGLEGAVRVFERLRRIARAPSLGGVESVASIPEHTTHARADAATRARMGIRAGMIRISVGLEDAGDLLADLTQALAVGPVP